MLAPFTDEGVVDMPSSGRELDLVEELYLFAVQHARSSANQPTEADDFLQEILIVFLEVNRRYKLPKVEMIKVAKTAARNRIRDLIRNKKVRIKYHISLEDVLDVGTFEEDSLRMAVDIIASISRLVSETGRKVLRLTHDGLTNMEISAILGISSRSVHGYIEEARIAYEIHHE